LIAISLTVISVLGMLTLFDHSSKLAKVESGVTGELQNLLYAAYYVTHDVRMAGAGGVPASTTVGGLRQVGVALNVGTSTLLNTSGYGVNNVNTTATNVTIGGCHVRKGTDIIHIRGAIQSPWYDLSASQWLPPGGSGSLGGCAPSATQGCLQILPCSKYRDAAAVAPCAPYAANDMSLFAAASSYPDNRMFVMTDLLGAMGIGIVPAGGISASSGANGITATIRIDVSAGLDGGYANSLNANGVFPTGLTSPSRGGFLDDRIYFVTDGTTAPAPACSTTNASILPGPCHPALEMADWRPDATPWDTATVSLISEDIEDLQVAYGMDFYDLNGTGSWTLANPAPPEKDPVTGADRSYPSDGSISLADRAAFNSIVTAQQGSTAPHQDPSESTAPDGDEWIWNVAGEPVVGTFDATSDLSRLRSLQIWLLSKAREPDLRYNGPGAMSWPLMDSAAKTVSFDNSMPYHRRVQRVRVDLRNFQVQ